MDPTIKLETIRQTCRVCFQNGDINIWDFRVKITTDETAEIHDGNPAIHVPAKDNLHSVVGGDVNEDKYINTLEILKIFNKTTNSLVLPDEFPLLCWQCLEDFRLCYIFHEKVKNSNMQLEKIYDECLNQCIEEEHLIEVGEQDDITNNVVNNQLNPDPYSLDDNYLVQIHPNNNNIDSLEPHSLPPQKSQEFRASKRRTLLDKNSSIVVTQYVPSAMEQKIPHKTCNTSNAAAPQDDEYQPPRNLHTVACKSVEIKDVNQLASLETSATVVIDNENSSASSAPVFVCQYCPQAFAKSEFLKTHIQRNHICQFCMQTFHHYTDLCQHLRQHKEHKCVICKKNLSSQTNLRHHIKRMHRINLPPKMTLLDFIQSKEDNEDNGGDLIMDSFPEMYINDVVNEDAEEKDKYAEYGEKTTSLGDIIYISKVVDVEGMIYENDVMELLGN